MMQKLCESLNNMRILLKIQIVRWYSWVNSVTQELCVLLKTVHILKLFWLLYPFIIRWYSWDNYKHKSWVYQSIHFIFGKNCGDYFQLWYSEGNRVPDNSWVYDSVKIAFWENLIWEYASLHTVLVLFKLCLLLPAYKMV